jgi:hypothetical protein
VCPVRVSVESHSLLVIATDGTSIQPVSVDSVVLFSGTHQHVGAGVADSILSGYRLDAWAAVVRSPTEAEDFSSSEAHPASYLMSTVGPFPGVQARRWRDADHSLDLVTRSKMSRSYTSYPPPPQALPWRVVGQL